MTLGSLGFGDIIKVDKKGRRFFAVVVDRQGRKLLVEPMDRNIAYRNVTAREVIGIWRATTATLARMAPPVEGKVSA